MTAYEIIFNTIQERVYNGELSFEDGEILNEMAYDRYAEDEPAYEESAYEEYLDNMVDDIYNESTRQAKEINKQYQNYNKAIDIANGILKPYYAERIKIRRELEKVKPDDPAYKNKKQQYDDINDKIKQKEKELNYNNLYKVANELYSIDSIGAAFRLVPTAGKPYKDKQREMFDLYPAKEKPARPELKEAMLKKQMKDLTKNNVLNRRVE